MIMNALSLTRMTGLITQRLFSSRTRLLRQTLFVRTIAASLSVPDFCLQGCKAAHDFAFRSQRPRFPRVGNSLRQARR
ncbi:unnamed protein product, partial [Mycena citricolor]